MTNKEALAILNMTDHIGPVTVRRLIQRFGSPQNILAACIADLKTVEGINTKSATAIAGWRETIRWEDELAAIQKHQLTLLTQEDDDYPTLLKQIHDPPLILYCRGRLHGEKNSIAVVGSRQTTLYGSETARRFGYQLGNIGLTVVSGLARGIDTHAHRGCLQAGGRAVAVLGFGFDYLSKAENARLADEIAAAHGVIISEFPCARSPDRQTFPMRNRIVSGMTMGALVVEAGTNSGALITANFALEQGRQVFAVPGRIDSPQSHGCNHLIKHGAKLVQSVEDIMEEFTYLLPENTRTPAPEQGRIIRLTETEQAVLSKIGTEETPIDRIIADTELPPAVVSATLMVLEMKKAVRQFPGKQYVRAAAEVVS
ncbi:MAG: DNA-processing protein DprA [Verrucomicrobiae bacterium]|nr:DNA-processing protein DprA [Verrucomicrobiae bacterium]